MSTYVELGRVGRGTSPVRGLRTSDRRSQRRRSKLPTALAVIAMLFGAGLLLGRMETPSGGAQPAAPDATPFHYFPR